MTLNGKIVELVLRTQNASDGGKRKKGQNIMVISDTRRGIRDNCGGYATKDNLMILAIEMIAKNHTDWKYAVKIGKDQNGHTSFIVYFQTKIMGEKVQISFHSFNNNLRKYVNNSFRIKWDHGCSRDSAVYAYNYYTCGYYA